MAPKSEICRTCLKSYGRKTFINLYSSLGTDKLISDVLMEVTPIKIHKDDGLPVNICDACIKKLQVVREFKAMVVDSDAKLHSLYNKDVNLDESSNVTIKEEIDDEEEDPLSSPQLTINDVNFESVSTDRLIDNSGASVSGVKSNVQSKETKEWQHTSEITIKDEEHSVEGDKIVQKPKENAANDCEDNSDMEDNDLALFEDCPNDEQNDDKIKKPSGGNGKGKTLPEHAVVFMEVDAEKNTKHKKVFCKLCDRSFGYKYYIGTHLRGHMGYKPFVCDVCGKKYSQRFLLVNHMRSHSEDDPYICDICGKKFKQYNSLYSHKLVHSDEKPFKCEICNKSFKTDDGLKTHLPRHNSEKSHVCDVCGKAFANKTDLYYHMKTHNEKTVPCPTCGKCFKASRFLKKHVDRVHLKVKNHACDVCDKHFFSVRSLRAHKWIHSGEKPYACKICGKTFRQDGCIVRHMRVHTGERPYSCDICSATFKYSQHHMKHMKSHEKD